MWGQSWSNILDVTIPYPGKNFLDVTTEMNKQVRKKVYCDDTEKHRINITDTLQNSNNAYCYWQLISAKSLGDSTL